jgi:hypothetical protein
MTHCHLLSKGPKRSSTVLIVIGLQGNSHRLHHENKGINEHPLFVGHRGNVPTQLIRLSSAEHAVTVETILSGWN